LTNEAVTNAPLELLGGLDGGGLLSFNSWPKRLRGSVVWTGRLVVGDLVIISWILINHLQTSLKNVRGMSQCLGECHIFEDNTPTTIKKLHSRSLNTIKY